MESKPDPIKKMAEFLRKGATMLSIACPNCQNPLFRFKNKEIYCAVCEKQVKIVKEDVEHDISPENSYDEKKSQKYKTPSNFSRLKQVLKNKIEELTNSINNENQISNLSQYIDVIDKIIKILIFLE